MICKIILIGSLYINPCNITAMYDLSGSCNLYFGVEFSHLIEEHGFMVVAEFGAGIE